MTKPNLACPYVNCTASLAADVDFCRSCGRRILFCPLCNSTNRAMAVYCRECGKIMPPVNECWMFKANPQLNNYIPSSLAYPKRGLNKVWERELEEEIVAPMVAAHGFLLICSKEGKVWIKNQKDGEDVIRPFVLADEEIHFAPAIDGHRLYIPALHNIYAYDLLYFHEPDFRLSEFKPLNQFSVPSPLIFITHVVANKEKIFIGAYNKGNKQSNLYLFRPDLILDPVAKGFSGRITTPALSEDILVVATPTTLFGLDAGSLDITWEKEVEEQIKPVSPAIMGGEIYFFNKKGQLFSISLRTGKGLRWVGGIETGLVNDYAISRKGFFVISGFGIFYYDAAGQLRFSGEEEMMAPPLITDNFFITASLEGRVSIHDINNPSHFYRYAIGVNQNIYSSPVMANNLAFICTKKGRILCYHL